MLAKLGGAIKCGNTEGVLREAWEGAGLRVTFMERRVMYTVIRPGVDRTTWSTGGGNKVVPGTDGLQLKYPDEYALTKEGCGAQDHAANEAL